MRKPIRGGVFAAVLLSLAAIGCSPAPSQPPTMPSENGGGLAPRGVRIDKNGVFANFYPAQVDRQAPAVLVLGGSEGSLNPAFNDGIRDLTAAGFNVLYLCYFGCPGAPKSLADVPLETFDRGIAFLRAQSRVDPARIAVAGVSKGGEAALLVGTRDPALKAVIAAVPSSVAWPGITYTLAQSASWTADGKPVPFLHYTLRSYFEALIAGIFGFYHGALPTIAQHPEAVIPVERITGRVLLICGEADRVWPSCPMVEQISTRLRDKGRPAAQVLRYKDAGHAAFGTPLKKTDPDYAQLARAGGTPEGNAAARADSWPKAIAFLKASMRVR